MYGSNSSPQDNKMHALLISPPGTPETPIWRECMNNAATDIFVQIFFYLLMRVHTHLTLGYTLRR